MKVSTYILTLAMSLSLVSFPRVNSQANPQTFWSDYPACEEACHESVWAAQQCSLANNCDCTSDSSSNSCLCLADSCLCETSSWLIAVAQCIGKSCGAGDVSTAASIAASACSGNGYPLAVASTALVSYGMAAVVVTTSKSSTSTSSSNPTPTSTPNSFLTSTFSPSSTPSSTLNSSPSSTSTSSPNSGSSQVNGIIAAYVVPSVICGITITVMLIIWIWKSDEFHALLRKICCCGSRPQGATRPSNGNHVNGNGIALRDLRGSAQPVR